MFDLATWQNGTLTLNIPIAVPFQIVAWAAIVSLPLIFLWAAIHSWPEIKKFAGPIWNKLPDGQPQKTVAWFSILFSPFWVILFVVTFGILLRVIWNFPNVFFASPENAAPDAASSLIDLRWYTLGLVALLTALGGLIAVPLSILRNFAIERQTKTAEENLTTSLINTAVEGLGAEKTVSRIGRPVKVNGRTEIQWRGEDFANVGPTNADKWQTFEMTEPNLEVRIGSILTLGQIAQNNPDQFTRVMQILSAYIKNNAPVGDQTEFKFEPWPEYVSQPSNTENQSRNRFLLERSIGLDEWNEKLENPRSDIQTALSTIGSNLNAKNLETSEGYRIDLRDTNLRRANFSCLNFSLALFCGSDLEGANFSNSVLDQADFSNAKLAKAQLGNASIESAQLESAWLERADLTKANVAKSNFNDAKMWRVRMDNAIAQEATFESTSLEGASFIDSDLAGTNFSNAKMQRTDLRNANLFGATLQEANLDEANLANANLAYANLIEVRMFYAILKNANLERADLRQGQLVYVDLRGSNLRNIDWEGLGINGAVHDADLRGAQNMTQIQIEFLVGNSMTLLPKYVYDNQVPSIPDSWENPPPDYVVKLLRKMGIRQTNRRNTWDTLYVCGPGMQPNRTGTPLAVEASYPENHPMKFKNQ